MSKPRHILSLSGGKDSTALALFMRDKVKYMEYVFCDTGKELNETYDYLNRVEAYLGKKIKWLMNFHKQNIPKPQKIICYPKTEFVEWHIREVFRGEYRD